MPLRLPRLRECLILALLLHALVVLVFGSAPGGSAKPGEGVYGALNIRLSGRGAAGPELAATPPPPAAYTGPQGAADERRWGGTVRDMPASPPPVSEPGAARLGTWNPVPTPQPTDPLPPTPMPLPVLEPAAPALQDVAPLPAIANPVASLSPGPALPELAPLPSAVRNLPAAAAQPLPIERALKPVAPLEAGVAPTPTLPALAPAPSPVRNLPTAAPQALPIERPLSRVAPVEGVAAPAPTVPALAPAPSPERSLPATAPQPVPMDSPALSRVLPVEPLGLPAAPAATPALQTLPEAAPGPRSEAPPGTASNNPPTPLPASGEPSASGSTPRATLGAPDAGAVVGHDVATAPSSPASAPRLNLDLVRPRGGEISRQGSRGVLSLLPHPPDSKLANDIEKSAKPDCRTAYSGLGLLAAAPLALDALRKDGCRW